MRQFLERVYLDANVVIGDFLYRCKGNSRDYKAHVAVEYLRSRQSATLYIGSFTLIQLMKTAQAAKIDKAAIRDEIKRMASRYELVHLEKKDVVAALSIKHPDLEDALQYALSQKVHCANVVSNDRHFESFADVILTKPGKIRKIQLGG